MDWNGAQTLCMYVCVRVCANNIGLFLANDLVKISQEHRTYTNTNRIESLLYTHKKIPLSNGGELVQQQLDRGRSLIDVADFS